MNLLGRSAKIAWWLMFGNLDEKKKAKLLKALEYLKNEAQHLEVKAEKNGITLKYKKEF